MARGDRHPPGTPAPKKGDYDLVGPRGGPVPGHDPATMKNKGDTLPPTPDDNQFWQER